MKKLMMIAAMMVAAISANAQNEVGQITLKPLVGVNLSTLTNTSDSKMRVGVAAGVEAEYGVASNFGVTAGVIYSMQGAKDDDETLKLDYLNVPILANYYVIPGLAIKAGIQPAFNLSSKYGDADVDAKGFDLSIPVGLSYEVSGFVVDARYNFGLTKTSEFGDAKNSVIQFTLGYKFSL